jgi:hypothetical protein
MSGKNQFPFVLNWQTTNPAIGYNPTPGGADQASALSGVTSGTMSSTNTIYSQIIPISKMDNVGVQLDWTGTPTGTITVQVSNNGNIFHALTFNPALAQPSGSAAGLCINLNQLSFRYIIIQYVNASGSGTLTGSGQAKDLN